jgi:hypothetical protein
VRISRQTYPNRRTGRVVHEIKVALPWKSARFLFRWEAQS